MSKKHEDKKLGMVPRAVALALSLVITGILAGGFASATDRLPIHQGTVTVENILE